MPETTPLIKAALNLRGGAGFDVYVVKWDKLGYNCSSRSIHLDRKGVTYE